MPIESERARPPINLMGIGRGEARQATYAMDPYQPLYAEGSRAEESPPDRAAYYRYYLAKRRAELDSSDSGKLCLTVKPQYACITVLIVFGF